MFTLNYRAFITVMRIWTYSEEVKFWSSTAAIWPKNRIFFFIITSELSALNLQISVTIRIIFQNNPKQTVLEWRIHNVI